MAALDPVAWTRPFRAQSAISRVARGSAAAAVEKVRSFQSGM
jgi:hypothetical protein